MRLYTPQAERCREPCLLYYHEVTLSGGYLTSSLRSIHGNSSFGNLLFRYLHKAFWALGWSLEQGGTPTISLSRDERGAPLLSDRDERESGRVKSPLGACIQSESRIGCQSKLKEVFLDCHPASGLYRSGAASPVYKGSRGGGGR